VCVCPIRRRLITVWSFLLSSRFDHGLMLCVYFVEFGIEFSTTREPFIIYIGVYFVLHVWVWGVIYDWRCYWGNCIECFLISSFVSWDDYVPRNPNEVNLFSIIFNQVCFILDKFCDISWILRICDAIT